MLPCQRCEAIAPGPDVELIETEHSDVVLVRVPRNWFPCYGEVGRSPIVCRRCATDQEINHWLASREYREDLSRDQAIALLDEGDG